MPSSSFIHSIKRQAFASASSNHARYSGCCFTNSFNCGSLISASQEKKKSKNYTIPSSIIQCHEYHATPKREILPMIGLATIAFVGRYSYKAMVRMNEEWADYEDDLEKYILEHGDEALTDDQRSNLKKQLYTGGYLGIDMGSTNLRISHYHPKAALGGGSKGTAATNNSTNASSRPKVVDDREGGRSTPSLCYQTLDEQSKEVLVWGRMAKSKFYERRSSDSSKSQVLSPMNWMRTASRDNQTTAADVQRAIQQLIRSTSRNALEKKLGAINNTNNENTAVHDDDQPLFGGKYGYDAKPIVAIPPSLPNGHLELFREALSKIAVSPCEATFVSEPMAAIEAAVHLNLFPSSGDDKKIVLFDVGTSSLRLYVLSTPPFEYDNDNENILYESVFSDFGGLTLQDACVNLLSRHFYNHSKELITDNMALQRLYDASESAILELSQGGGKDKNKRTNISIPYLSMDIKTMQPKHLEMGLSAEVLEQELNTILQHTTSSNDSNDNNALSTVMPKPTNISTLVSSMTMQALDQSAIHNPIAQIHKVLVMGGGGRSPIICNGVRDGLALIGGEAFANNVFVVPPEEMVEELVVLGASLLGKKIASSDS
eukprot:CAMPEP_0194410914 /NCGR_PEP_ID=MMETSP0176-20130528/9058_1 /TAXON_ID=216777 /ORGANISM="Proboscia alata, Strain PI-D3" /LENGTH=601 /DNA_ID=CAMNT_0039212567 /DNA_START=120 /DNA_END=1925 /DNA_ORIENTATION=-